MAHFEGEVRTEWLTHQGDNRQMLLLEDFAFVDDNGKRWLAPAGSVIDGASIPEFLWSSVIGTPFIGDYRRATVLHDVGCQERREPHKAVHRLFYDAMVADGVSALKAQKYYTAVRIFGPSWPEPGVEAPDGVLAAVQQAPAAMDIDELEAVLDAALGE